MTIQKLDKYIYMDAIDHGWDIDDLPIRPISGRTTHLISCLEVIDNVPPPDWHALLANIDALPPPFQRPAGCTMQIYSKKQADNNHTIVKHMSFDKRANIKQISENMVGKLYSLKKIKGVAPRILQAIILFEGMRLGGGNIVNMQLVVPAKKNRGAEEIQVF